MCIYFSILNNEKYTTKSQNFYKIIYMDNNNFIIFAGGGTGGHLWPGVVLAQEIQAQYPEFKPIFFVPGKPVDYKILENTNFPVHTNIMRSRPRQFYKFPQFLWCMLKGFVQTFQLFRKYPPKLVVGLGGYGSLSAGILAKIKHIPLVMIESNKIPGKVVRWFSSYCQTIYTQTDVEGIPKEKISILGIPIRSNLPIHKNYEVINTPFTILVMGGSQGSQSINQSICKNLPNMADLIEKVQFIHLCGQDAPTIEKEYLQHGFKAKVYAFYANMAELYQQTDLMICRSGGSTLAEISAIGIPSILVPLPTSSEGHQLANATWFQNSGASLVIEEKELLQKIPEILRKFLKNPEVLKNMSQNTWKIAKPEAAKNIAKDIKKWLIQNQ